LDQSYQLLFVPESWVLFKKTKLDFPNESETPLMQGISLSFVEPLLLVDRTVLAPLYTLK
jgi:hypothetical protein